MAKLYYFNGRGKAEIVRLALAAAGIPFDEEMIRTREQMLNLITDGKLLFGQLPMLETDGRLIVQTHAIVLYVGRKSGLMGKSLSEEVLVNQYYEGGRDFMEPTFPLCYLPEQEVLDGGVKKAMNKYLPIFEKIAAANGTGFLVGCSLTIADISLLECLLVCVEYLGIEILADYPALQRFYHLVKSEDRIAAYLAGPQRTERNDERYVREVCASPGMERSVMIAHHFRITK